MPTKNTKKTKTTKKTPAKNKTATTTKTERALREAKRATLAAHGAKASNCGPDSEIMSVSNGCCSRGRHQKSIAREYLIALDL